MLKQLTIKQNDAVTILRLETTERPRNVKKDGVGDSWIISKPKLVKSKGVIASLDRLYIPVRLADGSTRHALYSDLTFTKAGVSFKSKLPDRHRIIKGVEVNVVGKPITVSGKVFLNDLLIPVVVGGKILQIPFENLKFKE